MERQYIITEYGAVGDGKTDCTAAIQKALDEAKAAGGGEVVFPAGEYVAGRLSVPSHTKLTGVAGWSIRHDGGSVLLFNGDDAPCMLDLTGAVGCTIDGLTLDGGKRGRQVHGIAFLREDFFEHPEEEAFRIQDCQVRGFSGCGIYLQFACAFSVRHCQILENCGDGMYLNSWDAFIVDNWFSFNDGWGVRCADVGINNSAMSFTANRIEWNKKGGFYLRHAKLWQITGNFFDRQGGPDIHIAEGLSPADAPDPRWVKIPCHAIAVTGNVFSRGGANLDGGRDELDLCHIRMHDCFGVTVTGNTMLVGVSDGVLEGAPSPKYGMVLDRLKGCVIADNAMMNGYAKKQFYDLGGHGEQVIIERNVGSAMDSADTTKSFEV